MKTFAYTVSMLGFTTVSGTHAATRTHDAEVAAVKHFLDENEIETNDDPEHEGFQSMSDLIRFYAPGTTIRIVR